MGLWDEILEESKLFIKIENAVELIVKHQEESILTG